jgi:ABC-2 type transport system permease protein
MPNPAKQGSLMKSRILAILRKEFIHIVRDSKSLVIIFLMPLAMIFLFGYAITFEINVIELGLLDYDRSAESRYLLEKFTRSGYFRLERVCKDHDDIKRAILNRNISLALVIPENYSQALQQGEAEIQLIVDGSNANSAIVASNYAKFIIADYRMSFIHEGAGLVSVSPRIYYNPNLVSTVFIVPGLIAVLLMMICAMLTSITIVREKETGTLEQILVSPVLPGEIIIGKVTPYIIVGFLVAMAVLVFGKFVFAVPFRGSPLLLALLSVTYIYASLSLGVFISTKAKTQQVALMLSVLTTLLPSVLLSGFMFPIASMPPFLRYLTYIIPAKYYLLIIRGIMLKGISFYQLYLPTLILLLFGSIFLIVSMKRFNVKLEG